MRMRSITRRTFTSSLALAAAAAAVPAGALQAFAGKRLKVGHTGITWGFKPTDAEQAIADVGSLGFAGYESFGNVLEYWDKQGGLKRLLDAAQVPLRSAYCPVNLTDPAKRADEIAKLVPGYGGVTYARLERHGVHVPVSSYVDAGTPLLSPTADGAAKLTPRLVPAGTLD